MNGTRQYGWTSGEDEFEDDAYWQDYEREFEDEIVERRHRDSREKASQSGEGITLHFHHPLLGYTSLTMLKGEWPLSFGDMREQKLLLIESIEQLERKFEEIRKSMYR